MAQRQNSLMRIETPEMQGEGSFVLVRRITWGRVQEARKIHNQSGDEQSADFRDADLVYTEDVLRESIAQWNWVDDDGADMPLPRDGGIAQLSVEEVQFLLKLIFNPMSDAQKN